MAEISTIRSSDLYTAILLCGGKGDRLKELLKGNQKALLRIEGKELIRYSIDSMDTSIVKKLVFAVGHRAEQVEEWVRAVNLPYATEISRQTGSGVQNAIRDAAKLIEGDRIIFCNGDEVRLGLNLAEAVKSHESLGLLATVVGGYTDKLYKESVLEIRDEKGLVTRIRDDDPMFLERPNERGLASAGFFIINRKAIEYFDERYGKDWPGILFPLANARQLRAYVDPKIEFANINTQDDFYSVEARLKQKSRNG